MNGPGSWNFWKGQAVGCICCEPGVGTRMSSAWQWPEDWRVFRVELGHWALAGMGEHVL